MRCRAVIVLTVCARLLSVGQTADSTLQFEVASVKKAAPERIGRGAFQVRGGPGTNDPTRIAYTAVKLKSLVESAYRLKQFEVTGPDWMEHEYYDILAKVPEGATREQLSAMLRNLLIERFK